MSAHRDLTRGDGRLRIATWRGDATTAYLTPARGRPGARDVQECVEGLGQLGYVAALTAALGPSDQAPFLAVGFEVHERLHLLRRPIDPVPAAPARGVALRRSRRGERDAVLAVDNAAFPPFWRMDGPALDDAIAATPAARMRVAERTDGERGLGGYAVTGRAGPRGYLQRLAVAPGQQRQGIGAALVVDGLRWLRRWGAREVFVNTQEDNRPALELYERLGFCRQADGLAVLRRVVEAAP
jgi:ribosomal protein S18 acetylase RimI-like enzyme